MNDPLLQLSTEALAITRGDRLLVNNLSFELAAGHALQLQGPNGSGKTSLLRVLAGLLYPNDGQVYWGKQPISQLRDQYLKQLCYLGHHTAVKSELTPLENLAYSLGLSGQRPRRAELVQALDACGLRGFIEQPAYQLSAGQRRRIALARLWLSKACLWIADEPLTAIDGAGVSLLTERFESHLAAGGMLVFTTHQQLSLSPHRMHHLCLGQV